MLCRALEDGDADGDHRGRERGRARETEMDDDEEQREDGDDEEARRVKEMERPDDLVRDPRAGLRRKDGRAEADADAEQHERAPSDALLRFLPRHDADAWQHHERDGDDRRRGRVKRVEFFLRRPEEQQDAREDHELLFVAAHGAERLELVRDLFLAALNLVHFRRHHLQQDEIQQRAHDDGERRGSDEPVEPADRRSELLLDEAERDHVLRSGRLNADVPDGISLRDGDEHDGGELALARNAEDGDDAHDDRHHATDARRRARHEEAQHEAREDDAGKDVVRPRADLREDEERDALVEPRLHHGGRDEHRRADERERRRREAGERELQARRRAEHLRRVRHVGRRAQEERHERDDDARRDRIRDSLGHPDDDGENEDADHAVAGRREVGGRRQHEDSEQHEDGDGEAHPMERALRFSLCHDEYPPST